jgi:hypothetical protein
MSGKRDRQTPEELRADIEQAREALGETAEELVAKFDLGARSKDALEGATDRLRQGGGTVADTARQGAQQLGEQVKDGSARVLDQAKRALDELPEPVRDRGRDAVAVVRQRPVPTLAVVVALLVLWQVIRRLTR